MYKLNTWPPKNPPKKTNWLKEKFKNRIKKIKLLTNKKNCEPISSRFEGLMA